ncbi:MAG TPA: nuclease-related domain-containing protein [Frankiaceae bacterium]|nr:nuclease-related domain-containing protein [Frankiaceae bacterium]
MGELVLTPWRRYGHDRVYVADGTLRLGHLDRNGDSLTVTDESRRAEVRAALVAAGYLTDDATRAEPERKAPPPEPWAITLPGDTATFKPGAGARAKAREERDAAPVRTTLARLLKVHTDERAWRVGADGEEAVARRLRRLGGTWSVLHDLPIGDSGANVDHVAIGPGGVFTMNTKNLTGKVWVGGDTFLTNGHRTDYVRKARHEARRVARLLTARAAAPVTVHGVVVVLADEFMIKEQPRDVTVVEARRLVRWLERHPPALSAEQLRRLERVARDPSTWR